MMRIRMGLLLGLLLAVGVAGCGASDNGGGVASLDGSKQPTGTTPAGGRRYNRQEALDSARCMRQHGIDVPDPQFTANGIDQTIPDRAVQNSAKFKAAEQACKQYVPNGGQPDPQADAQRLQRALAFARCVRQHGITNMPDPQMTADGTIGQELPGRMDPDDPRFKAAERACHQYGGLRPPPP